MEETVQNSKKSGIGFKINQYKFLFKQLVKRDFTGRYKKAFLGVLWSMLSPLFTFAAQAIIFSTLFHHKGDHYISYLVIGNVVYHYFTDATNSGMFSIASNAGIISKIKVPKSIFLLSKSVSCLLNFALTMIIMFTIVFIDGARISWEYLLLIVPIITMTLFNLGVGNILSAWFVFFKDTQYLYGIFTQILMYFSAIFYKITIFPESSQKFFYLNPLYCYISYFRTIIIDNSVPELKVQILGVVYALIVLGIGYIVQKRSSNKYIFYF